MTQLFEIFYCIIVEPQYIQRYELYLIFTALSL